MERECNPPVLIATENTATIKFLHSTLEKCGYRILVAYNADKVIQAIKEDSPALVIIPRFTPAIDGLALCMKIKQRSQIPIILLNDSDDIPDKIRCLDAGADDYVTKAVSARELIARMKALLRRGRKRQDEQKATTFHSNDLTIDFSRNRVTIGSREINLTAREYKILCYLAYNAGRVVTPDQILSSVWGEEYLGETHLLQVNINRLRLKLDDDAKNPRYVLTKSGIGYIMNKRR